MVLEESLRANVRVGLVCRAVEVFIKGEEEQVEVYIEGGLPTDETAKRT